MNGKSKCKILKEIRRKIAQDNDIAFVTSECKHKGDCAGTCPKCEAEVRYLEEELQKRQRVGKTVAVAGIAAALVVGTTGCDLPFVYTTAGDPLPYTEQVDGEIAVPGGALLPEDTEGTEDGTVEVMGDMVVEDDQCQTETPDGEYMGDPLPE